MTHHLLLLLLLLPLLTSVWGDADPWVDNDLYYGTVYQVLHHLVGGNVQGFSHSCIINMPKKLEKMMTKIPIKMIKDN